MNIQTKASFKKEYLAFSRTKKLFILSCVFMGLSVFSPLLIRGMTGLMDSMSDMYSEFGMDISGLTGAVNASAALGAAQGISGLTDTGLLVFLILINNFAGGEQKKRSVIIPNTSGLKGFSYITPKFVIYPLAIFILAVIGAFTSAAVSIAAFDTNDIIMGRILTGGILSGVYLMMYVCFHISLGTATGQAGMSSAVCVGASLLLPNIFAIANAGLAYNPFTINLMAANAVYDKFWDETPVTDIIMTVVIALASMVIVYLLALFAQSAKKIDNSGNEISI